jgi:hypothetical protein
MEPQIVELKVAKAIDDIHRAQCLNYLKATGLHLCLLLNFGRPHLEIKRIRPGPMNPPPPFACFACFAVPIFQAPSDCLDVRRLQRGGIGG